MSMKRALRSSVISAILRQRQFQPEDAVVLSCDPRSGSTWLSELLCASTPSAVIWEPFHLDNAPRVRELGFAWRQYIPPDADWPEAEALVRDILSGRTINTWTSWASPVADFSKAERLIIKCCRANGLLPWMVRRIEFKRRPVHFLRHPFAIAASQMKMGNFGTSGMTADLERGPFSKERADSAHYIRGLESDEERIVAMWCRTQKPALEDALTENSVVRMFYETLSLYPEREISRLFKKWDAPIPPNALAQVQKASRMTQDVSLLESPEQQVGKWQHHFSDRQIGRMSKILSDFGINVYGENPMPMPTEP